MSKHVVPTLTVIAGPNGAGKTTLTNHVIGDRVPVVNPDTIAARDLPRKPDGRLDEREAGRMALNQRHDHIAAGHSFAFETTLSGNSERRTMQAARDAGYRIHLVYVGVESPEHSMRRVADRVAKGGHDVPADAIERRYHLSMNNLPKAAAIADRVTLYDNSGRAHRLIGVREHGRERQSAPMPRWVLATKIIPGHFYD
jgi:predicted ABC-type ATPase